MALTLRVRISTPKEVAYDGPALAVTLPAETGVMQVYPGHIPVLARVQSGTVRIERQKAEPLSFSVDEGFFRVTKDDVSLLISRIEPLSD